MLHENLGYWLNITATRIVLNQKAQPSVLIFRPGSSVYMVPLSLSLELFAPEVCFLCWKWKERENNKESGSSYIYLSHFYYFSVGGRDAPSLKNIFYFCFIVPSLQFPIMFFCCICAWINVTCFCSKIVCCRLESSGFALFRFSYCWFRVNFEVTQRFFVICVLQGALQLHGLNDPDGKPVLLCACNDSSVHLYELPS